MKYLSKIPFIRIWANLFIFKGKETTIEYLVDLLLYSVFAIVLTIVLTLNIAKQMPSQFMALMLYFVICYLMVVPLISMTSRKFYTVGIPWGLCFVILIPVLGVIWTTMVSLTTSSGEISQEKTAKRRIVVPIAVSSVVSPLLSIISAFLIIVFLIVIETFAPPIVKTSVKDYQFIFNIVDTFKWGEKDIIGFGEYKYNSHLLLVPRETPSTLKKFYYRYRSGSFDVDDYGFYFECKLEKEKYDNYVDGLDNFTIRVEDTTKKLVKVDDVFDYPTYVVQWYNTMPKWQVFEYIMLDEKENTVVYAFSMSFDYDQIIKKASYNIAPKNGTKNVSKEMDGFSIYKEQGKNRYYKLDEMVYDTSFLNNLL